MTTNPMNQNDKNDKDVSLKSEAIKILGDFYAMKIAYIKLVRELQKDEKLSERFRLFIDEALKITNASVFKKLTKNEYGFYEKRHADFYCTLLKIGFSVEFRQPENLWVVTHD